MLQKNAKSDAEVAPPLLLLEFNELCPHLLDRWMAEGLLPHFKELHARSLVFETLADEPEGPNLEPWIQWHSIHTGLPFRQHRVFHLTEGKTWRGSDWYRHFLDHGLGVASFGSMNVRPFEAGPNSFFLADPWSEENDASPPELNSFNNYVAHMVREYTNRDNQPALGDHLRFARFLLSHGLSLSSVFAAVRQLARERFSDRRHAFRRVAILDRLTVDMFAHFYRQRGPDFATIFLNSTAHLQHAYWRHLEPEKFQVPPEDPEFYRDAVLFGYQAMDRLVGRLGSLARPRGARLAFATALSQQPFLKYEASGGQHFYRLRDPGAFLEALGIRFRTVEPVMTHQYMGHAETPEDEQRAKAALGAIQMNDKRAFMVNETKMEGVYFGCQVNTSAADGAILEGLPAGMNPDFFAHLYRIDALKSGRHHPHGCFWVEFDRPARKPDPVSILDIYPTVAALLNVPMPDDLKAATGGYGRNLLLV